MQEESLFIEKIPRFLLEADPASVTQEEMVTGDFFAQAEQATTTPEITSTSRNFPPSQAETVGLRERRKHVQLSTVIEEGPLTHDSVNTQESSADKSCRTVPSYSANHENIPPARSPDHATRGLEIMNDIVRQQSEERRAIMASNERKDERIRKLVNRNNKVVHQLAQKEVQIEKMSNEVRHLKDRLENEELERNRVKKELEEKERKISELEQTITQSEVNNENECLEEIKRQLQQVQQTLNEEKREKYEMEQTLARKTRRIEHLEDDVKKAGSEVEKTVRERECLENVMLWTKEDIEEEDEEEDEIECLNSKIEEQKSVIKQLRSDLDKQRVKARVYLILFIVIFILAILVLSQFPTISYLCPSLW